jgi:hypothetical protein
VNQRTDHRPTYSTVTKETQTVTSLRNFFSLSDFRFAAGEAVPDQAAQGRREGSVLRTRPTEDAEMRGVRSGRSVVRRLALLTALASFACLLVAGPAAAESPWWHLTSGARPTHLNPGTARNEVYRLTVQATEGSYFLEEPTAEEFAKLPFDATAAEIQTALEGLYGAGNVEVTETGPATFEITFVGTRADQPVELATFGEVTLTELAKGRPDGLIYVTATNLGDLPLSGSRSPVELTDTLPPDLRPVGIAATKGGAEGGFTVVEPLPCKLQTLTCSLEKNAIGPLEGSDDALPPFTSIEMRIAVVLEPGAHSGELNQISVSGGEGYSCDSVPAATGSYYDRGCTVERSEAFTRNFERSYTGPVPPLSLQRPIVVDGELTPFGVEEYELRNEEEGGAPATQAASHPFQQTTSITLNQGPAVGPLDDGASHKPVANPAALAKDLHFDWPPGLIGNPSGVTQCTDTQFFADVEGGNANACPASSAVGVAVVTVNEPVFLGGVGQIPVPLFNLVPHYGEPARFGFNVVVANAPVVIDTALRSDGDYGVTVESDNITQTAALLSATVSVWGVPGDPRHNAQRGSSCLLENDGFLEVKPTAVGGLGPCSATETPPGANPAGFLFLPTSCGPAPTSTVLGDSWADPFDLADLPLLATYQMPALDSCNKVPFAPSIEAEPTSDAATSATGLNFAINIDDEGQQHGKSLVQSQIKKAVVTLPEGFTTNPSVAEGLHACPQATYEGSTVDGSVACPEDSKVGDVEIESPLVPQKVLGSLYVAEQGHNPNPTAQNPNGNLLTIYMVARNPELGVLIKQALRVNPNPVTGQLTTEVDDIPQLPFSRFHLSFRQGQRSPLITPPTCGTYTVQSELYPYSNPTAPVHGESSFKIETGPEGQGCPSGVPPFHPALLAGSENPTAGVYSPFYTEITRKDSEQEITRFSIKLPTGEIAKLKGVSECSDAQIALAKSREVEGGGGVEQASPACPQNSEIGHTQVGTGVGNVLAYAPGKLYLAGPYHGSPISLVSITAAKVGPFDLGTVVVRFALDVNHETAEVSVDGANSDPIPHIVDGIPVHLRDIQAFVDRPGFTLNPTSCAKKSTASTVLGSGLNFASSSDDVPVTVSSPFQVASCVSLGFAPKLALNLVGKKTHRGALPAFKAVLTYPKGGNYANIAKAQVTLPGSEFLEQGHLKNVCTRKVFETGKNPGENCPANSIYGKARAVTPILDQPLEGPVYLRTGYGTRLPELAAALNGPQISITLAGTIDSVHQKGTEGSRIRNTFAVVPDAPVEKFTLELKGGKKGLLVNSTDVCKGTHKALAAFTGQNGKLSETEPALKAQCGKGGGKKKSAGKKKGSTKNGNH